MTPCSTQLNKKYVKYSVNKTRVQQGVELGKLPCSVPCSAHDEKLKVKIEKLKQFFHVFEQSDNHCLLTLNVKHLNLFGCIKFLLV